MTDIKEWFKSLPLFTRYWLGLTAVFSLLGRFGIIHPSYLILTYESVFHKFQVRTLKWCKSNKSCGNVNIFYLFQIWRLATSVFFYPISGSTGIHFLFNCYFLYNYSLQLENVVYLGRPADYAFLLLFNWICTVIAAFMFKFYVSLIA